MKKLILITLWLSFFVGVNAIAFTNGWWLFSTAISFIAILIAYFYYFIDDNKVYKLTKEEVEDLIKDSWNACEDYHNNLGHSNSIFSSIEEYTQNTIDYLDFKNN